MLFFDIIDTPARWLLSISVLLFLIFSAYQTRHIKISRGLNILTTAVIVLFTISVLQQFPDFFYRYAVSAKILTLTEMLLVLAAALLLTMASSRILINAPLNIAVLSTFSTVGLCLILYAIFIANDANLVNNIRQLLPIIGMIYVFLSFISKPKVWLYPGTLTAAVAVLGYTALMICPMIMPQTYPWYIPLDLTLLLALSFYMMQIDELKQSLQLSEDTRLRTSRDIEKIIKSSPFPIMISNLSDDTLLLVNDNAVKLFGLDISELHQYRFRDFFVDAANRKLLTEKLEQNKEVQNFEILVKTAAGNTPFWLLASVNVIDYHNGVALYSAFQDITLRKKRERVLQTQADRDPLTAIFNRRYFESKAAEKIKKSHEKKEPFAVLMIDADNFKKINDTYGHKTGDKVLIELASTCERALRENDLVARYGGEEFVVFLTNVTPEIAQNVSQRLKDSIAAATVYSDNQQPVNFTVSIGIAPSGISDNISLMIKMADDAMYIAKQNGRNRIEIFSKERMSALNLEEMNRSKNKERLVHPAFSKEDKQEISLLDGIETNYMIEE